MPRNVCQRGALTDHPALGGWAGYIWAEKRANTFGQQLPAVSLYLLHIYQGRNTFNMKSIQDRNSTEDIKLLEACVPSQIAVILILGPKDIL